MQPVGQGKVSSMNAERNISPSTLESLLGKFPGHEKGFDKPVGPTEKCYSPRAVVRLFEWGVTERDLYHIAECLSCQTWVSNYSQYKEKPLEVGKITGKKKWSKSVMAFFSFQEPVLPHPHPVLLYVDSSPLQVDSPTTSNMEVAFTVAAGLPQDRLLQVDVESLRLQGGILAEKASIEAPNPSSTCTEWWKTKYPTIRFRDGRLAKEVQKDLHRHFKTNVPVCLEGRFVDNGEENFSGLAGIILEVGG